jgi:predicted enzyme related to lactoylglutathione lyase
LALAGRKLGDMFNPNFVLLYVENPTASAAFYAKVVGHAPVETSPTFALFALRSGLMLGLWSKHTVEPAAQPHFGGSELGFPVADADTVRTMHAAWVAQGLPIAQPPTDLDFGHTFVALDPDGHRLRVFAPNEPHA